MKKSRKVNLIHVILKLDVGGLERVVIDLLRNLNLRIYNPILCCLEKYGTMIQEVNELGIDVIALGKKEEGLELSLIPRLAKILRQNKIDILHSHNSSPHFYSTLAGKVAGTPINIYTIHGQELHRADKLLSYMTDMIVAVSDDARKLMVRRGGIPQRKVMTILNGIDEGKYHSDVNVTLKKRSIGLAEDDLVIGIVARLAPEKDHNTLLEAFKIVLQKTNKKVKLVVVGDGNLRKELEEKARHISISENTIFLGERHDVPELLATFDLFVLSSLTEGISLTLLEAMAAGLPIVATNVGGNPEIVLNNQTGIIVPSRDPISMANGIVKVIGNINKAKQMGEMGKDRMAKVFSVKTMAKKYEEVYDKFLSQRKVL